MLFVCLFVVFSLSFKCSAYRTLLVDDSRLNTDPIEIATTGRSIEWKFCRKRKKCNEYMKWKKKRRKKDCAVNVGIFKSVWKESCGCNVLRRIVSFLAVCFSLSVSMLLLPFGCVFFSIPIRKSIASIVRSIDAFFIAANFTREYVRELLLLLVGLFFRSSLPYIFFFRSFFVWVCIFVVGFCRSNFAMQQMFFCCQRAKGNTWCVQCVPFRVWCYIQSYKLIDALVTIPDWGWGIHTYRIYIDCRFNQCLPVWMFLLLSHCVHFFFRVCCRCTSFIPPSEILICLFARFGLFSLVVLGLFCEQLNRNCTNSPNTRSSLSFITFIPVWLGPRCVYICGMSECAMCIRVLWPWSKNL